jgi:hypothetical protein
MRITFLLLLICMVSLAVRGQDCAQKASEPQAPAEQSAQPPSERYAQPAPPAQWPQPAPQPGHPLDPNDVAILTGHPVGPPPARSPYGPPMLYTYTAPYSYGYANRYGFGPGSRFGFNGFFFSRPGPFGAPFFGSPFGRFSFSGFAAGPH